jgi:hypothetical protein
LDGYFDPDAYAHTDTRADLTTNLSPGSTKWSGSQNTGIKARNIDAIKHWLKDNLSSFSIPGHDNSKNFITPDPKRPVYVDEDDEETIIY